MLAIREDSQLFLLHLADISKLILITPPTSPASLSCQLRCFEHKVRINVITHTASA